MKPHYPCPHCGSDNTDYRGPQESCELDTKRYYTYPLVQCDNCETSFGVIAEKTYTGRVFEKAVLS